MKDETRLKRINDRAAVYGALDSQRYRNWRKRNPSCPPNITEWEITLVVKMLQAAGVDDILEFSLGKVLTRSGGYVMI
jgi:hypothetical protein